MKKWTYILAVIAVFDMGLSSIGWSIQNPGIMNPGIRNPAGVSTVPPSSLGGGLVTSPSPFNRTGNDMMTGNLRGGRSFRGGIPYRSRTTFWGGLASTEAVNLRQVGGALSPANTLLGPTPDTASLDSFLRDSAGWEDFGTYSGKYMTPQYYSRKNAVPTTIPGRSGVFKPMDSRITGTAPDVFGLEVLRNQTLPEQDTSTLNIAMRPTPLTPDEIGRLASGQTRVRSKNEPLFAEQYRKQLEQVRLDLIKRGSKMTVAKTVADTEKEDLLRLLPKPSVTRTERGKDFAEIQELVTPFDKTRRLEVQTELPKEQQKTEQNDIKELPGSDIFEKGVFVFEKGALDKLLSPYMQEKPDVMPNIEKEAAASNLDRLTEQIANLRHKGSGISTAEPLQVGADRTNVGAAGVPGKYPATELDGFRMPGGELPGTDTLPDTIPKSYRDLVLKNAQEPTDEVTLSEADKIKSLSDMDVSVRAKRILGEHKSHESLSQARFKKYMTEAQAYMKQGKYYQAVGAFAQASIFDSKKPATSAGRSLALFGAGEYMSSALFLSRAIEMSEEFARSKVDLAAAMGDRDKLETRITDAEEWLERSCASELEFLLAYMYYHSGRLEPAKRAIESAEKEMPNSKAVQILKEVINAAPKPPKVK